MTDAVTQQEAGLKENPFQTRLPPLLIPALTILQPTSIVRRGCREVKAPNCCFQKEQQDEVDAKKRSDDGFAEVTKHVPFKGTEASVSTAFLLWGVSSSAKN